MQTHLEQSGNGWLLPLDPKMLEQLGIDGDTILEVSIENGLIRLVPIPDQPDAAELDGVPQ